MSTMVAYSFRADIEGLRALAVLSVVANHAFPSVLSGGFIGVDIFFVISGYLIGKNLLLSLADGTFSLVRFYGKRARRLFPALTAVLLAVWCIGYLVFTGPEFIAFGRHMAVSAVFSNNILLWTESGYFDASASAKPLLHLWSLGIEEQFYLLAPCLLWLGLKLERKPIAWVGRLGVFSLLLMLFSSNIHPSASFYLLHTRFWELAAGMALGYLELRKHAQENSTEFAWPIGRELVLHFLLLLFAATLLLISVFDESNWQSASGLALLFLCATIAVKRTWTASCDIAPRPPQRHERFSNLLAATGLAIICTSSAVFVSRDWPGAHAIWPVVGTLLVLASPSTTFANGLLAPKFMTWIGSISYPLYLWHWPLIVVWRLMRPEATSWEQLAPVGISFVLAWATKRYIEDPVRFGLLRRSLPSLLSVSVLLSMLGVSFALGLTTVTTQGLPSRFSEELRAVADWSGPAPQEQWRMHTCYHYLNDERDFASECTPNKRAGIPRILLWGDSHAAQLYPGLTVLQDQQKFDIAQWTTGSCPPTFTPITDEGPACPAKRAQVLRMLSQDVPDTVLLAGAWELYRKNTSDDEIVPALGKTVRRLKEFGVRRIVVFGPGPIWKSSLQSELFIYLLGRRSNQLFERLGGTPTDQIPERLGHVPPQDWRLDTAMASEARAGEAHYFSVLNLLCNVEGCLTLGDRTRQRPDLLFWDRDHLTISGSVLVMKGAQNLILDSSSDWMTRR